MTRKRRLSASVDADLVAAGQAAVAAGTTENLSAWVSEAVRRQAEHDRRLATDGDEILTSDPDDVVILTLASGVHVDVVRL